jgi:hypothetical protein
MSKQAAAGAEVGCVEGCMGGKTRQAAVICVAVAAEAPAGANVSSALHVRCGTWCLSGAKGAADCRSGCGSGTQGDKRYYGSGDSG